MIKAAAFSERILKSHDRGVNGVLYRVPSICSKCYEPWPCDAYQLAEAVLRDNKQVGKWWCGRCCGKEWGDILCASEYHHMATDDPLAHTKWKDRLCTPVTCKAFKG